MPGAAASVNILLTFAVNSGRAPRARAAVPRGRARRSLATAANDTGSRAPLSEC